MDKKLTVNKYSPFRRGADNGFILGIYLSVMFIFSALNLSVPFAGLVSLVMALSVPAIIYIFLRRSFVKDYGLTIFSSLWMQGIVAFFCGTLIMALTAYIYMQWISPDFLIEQMTAAIDSYKSLDHEQSRKAAEILQKIIDNNLIPTPIQIAIQMIWLGVFTGSLLSIIVSLLVQARKVETK